MVRSQAGLRVIVTWKVLNQVKSLLLIRNCNHKCRLSVEGAVGWEIQGYKGIGVPTPLRAEVVAGIDCVLSRRVGLPQHFAGMPFSIPSSPGGRPLLL